MTTDGRPNCSVFSEKEIETIRGLNATLKLLIGLLITCITLLGGFISLSFVPFQTVTTLSNDVGRLSVLLEERHKSTQAAFKKIELEYASLRKRTWWIDRHAREGAQNSEKIYDKVLSYEPPRCREKNRE